MGPDELTHAHEALDMMNIVWYEVIELRRSRQLWEGLRPALSDDQYAGARDQLRRWYRTHLLSGCRRLVDPRKDSVSLVRALQLLKKDSAALTIDAVYGLAEDRFADRRREVQSIFESHFGAAEYVPGSAIDASIRRLHQDHKAVVDLASATVAHRAKGRGDGPAVTIAQVEALFDDVMEVVNFWSGLLRSTHLDENVDHLDDGLRPMALALSLFNFEAFVEAQMEAMTTYGPGARINYDAIEETAQLEYRFDAGNQER